MMIDAVEGREGVRKAVMVAQWSFIAQLSLINMP